MIRRKAVRLEPSSIIFPNTFVNTTNRYAFTITNLTENHIHFSFRDFPTNAEENLKTSLIDLSSSTGRQEMNDIIQFHSDFFILEPTSGELWPHRSQQIIVSFTPAKSIKYEEKAFLFISETKERTPVIFEGTGLPPCAQFNVTSINVGAVALESILEYQVFLENIGEVPVHFSLIKQQLNGNEFEFEPESGMIPVRNKVPITITFTANQVTQFNETFQFDIQDINGFKPFLNFFGRVIGPVFSLSTSIIDFGRVSLGTIHRKTFVIENKSLIPFDFSLRTAHDGSFAHREINLIPSGGFIDKFGKQAITVEFIPTEEKEETAQILLDIAKFGEKLRVIPIKATIIEPELKIENANIDLGVVYIGHKYEHILKLINDSDLFANFYYEPIDDISQVSGEIEPFSRTGSIQPKSEKDFLIYFTPKMLGQISINGNLRITGSNNSIPFSLNGISAGPNLVVTPQHINLGKIKVLNDIKKIIKIENKSPISANYTIEITAQFPVFSINKTNGSIGGNKIEEFELLTNLDDCRTFTANIIFHVEHLHPIVIPVRALGIGVPIVTSISMEDWDLGTLLTEHTFIRSFTIENKGMRKCSVMFSIQKPKLIGCTPKDFSSGVFPMTSTIDEGQFVDFDYTVQCPYPSEFTMQFQCHATLGNHRIVMYNPKISGNFVHPHLMFSTSNIDFVHFHDYEKEEELSGHSLTKISPSPELLPLQKQQLSVTNLIPIAVDVDAEIPPPFILSQTHFRLEPNVETKFEVTFDPLFKTDFISERINKKLLFYHGNHSMKFGVNVSAEMYFPNIDFFPKSPIDFGLMLINTERAIDVEMINSNDLETTWEWELLPDEENEISNIFDIYPIHGHMAKGDKKIVHFSFIAHGDRNGNGTKHSATAVCHIKGGPDYQINLTGCSSNIDFRVEPISINFGHQYFLSTLNDSLTISNLGDDSISFEILIPRGNQFKQIVVDPMEGILEPQSTIQLALSIIPGMPKQYKDHIIIRVARIQEIEIPILVIADFQQVQLSIPRAEDDPSSKSYESKVVEIQRRSKNPEIPSKTEEYLRQLETQNYLSKLQEPPSLIPIFLDKKKKTDLFQYFDFRGYVNAKYLIEMGHIVLGDIRTVTFTLKNVTTFPLSGKFVQIALEGTGFRVEPTSFEELAVDDSIEFNVIFDNNTKTIEYIGDVSFDFPLLFTDDFGIMFHLTAQTEMPSLKISNRQIDFGNVIIGQFLTMTIQLQNMNPVQVDYEFGHPKDNDKYSTKSYKSVFTTSPSKGTLPSQTFQNIDLTFSPNEETQYSFTVPITIPHSDTPAVLQISGCGVKIDLTFDPPDLRMPSILPFNEPSTFEVTMNNNSPYPIEVFSYQFDFLNYVNARLETMGLPPFRPGKSLNTNMNDSLSTVSKFALCVIVHGVTLSGRSTISTIVSEHLDNAPILRLKDIWKDLLEQQEKYFAQQKEIEKQNPQLKPQTTPTKPPANRKNETTPAENNRSKSPEKSEGHHHHHHHNKDTDGENNNPEEEEIEETSELITCPTDSDFIEKFQEAISDPLCTNGFVLDGLDVFKEPDETEQFIAQSMKHKNYQDESHKNPFMTFPHSTQTAWERALSYVLASFDGHYVFLIALKCTEEECRKRQEQLEHEERKRKREKAQKRRQELINMTEAQYDLLDEKAQEEADRKRKQARDKIIKAAQEAIEEENARLQKEKKLKKSRSSSKRSSSVSATKSDKSAKPETKLTPRPEKSEKPPASEKKKESSEKKREPEKRKAPLKSKLGVPLDLIPFSILEYNFTIGTIVERLQNENESFQVVDTNLLLRENTPTTSTLFNLSNEQDPEFQQRKNSLLLNACDSIENLTTYIHNFLPSLTQMKEKSFTRLIPKPKKGIIDYTFSKKMQINKIPTSFKIIVDDIVSELLLNEQPASASSQRKSGRSSRKQKTRNDPHGLNSVIPFIDELDLSQFTPRWNIEPNSSKTITVQFKSVHIGQYIDSLNFGIVDCKFDVYKLKIEGNCVYPEIDRNVSSLFSSVVPKFNPKVTYSWITNLESFHCGYLLLTNTNQKAQSSKQQQQQNQYKFPITLNNISEFQTDIMLRLGNDTSKIWVLDPPNLSIKPSATATVQVIIHPNVADVMKTTLQVLIKDNPIPLQLPLIAEGTLPLIELNPSIVDFERCMLKQTKSIEVTLTNNGKIACEWQIKSVQHLAPSITIDIVQGIIQPKNSAVMTVSFQSAKAIQVKKSFVIEVFDMNRTKLFSNQTVNIIAEAYDTHFEVIYPKGTNHLMFGNMKIGQLKTIPIQLKNKCKYPVHYLISPLGNLATNALTISQPDGMIQPGEKAVTVNIGYQRTRVSKIENQKMLSLRVNDPLTNTVTNTIPLFVSAETVIAKYTIEQTTIDFGSVPVNSQNEQKLRIQNNGVFPFTFDISQDETEIVSTGKRGRGRGRGRARGTGRGASTIRSPSTPTRGKGNKKLGPAIAIDSFIVQPSIATVDPGQTMNVNVNFHQTTMDKFSSHAIIRIQDSPTDHFEKITLMASTCIPGLQNSDYEKVFQESHLCLRSDLIRKNINAFLEDEHTFHFAPLILHDVSTVPIHLVNPFPISSIIDITLKPKNKSGLANFPFEISEKSITVQPNSEHVINLTFSPATVDSFIGFFEANVKGGVASSGKTLKFCVEGQGSLPSLTLLTKLDKGKKEGMYNVSMGRVLLNTTREKTIAIQNNAFIPANVNVTVKQQVNDFYLKDADYFAEPILLQSGHTMNITVGFKPEKAHRINFDVIVSCENNPKNDFTFTFVGEGFVEDVVFDGSIEDENDVVFKDNVVGRQQQATFKMRNICNEDVRFTWGQHHDFTFTPRIGHLKSGHSKQITITFFTNKPVKFNLLKIPCQWQKIELEDPNSPDWDDSMRTTEFITPPKVEEEKPQPPPAPAVPLKSQRKPSPTQKNAKANSSLNQSGKIATKQLLNRPRSPSVNTTQQSEESSSSQQNEKTTKVSPVKVVTILPEPKYKAFPTKLKDLTLRVFAISDFIKYSIDTTNIPFAPTMMYERRVYDIKVTNTSQIKFEYQWSLEDATALRKTTTGTPFSIMPDTGVLTGGQSKIFKVHFAPEEVDDFTATFKMMIPYLSVMEPPRIYVTGLSRRPLCHFNVEMSDYLSAGRRHPAYTDPLPEDVKVIELFSKGIGKKTIKKFEVINPTSAPYEITWTKVNPDDAPSVQCLVPQALVSSGKKYVIGFTYTPTSVKTVESLWQFRIKEHNVNINFLIVGRIIP